MIYYLRKENAVETGKLRLAIAVCLAVALVVYLATSMKALANPLGCNTFCNCLEVLAYEDIGQAGSGHGWKEVTGGGDYPTTWGEPDIWTRGGGCGSGQMLGTGTVRYYDYDTLEICDTSGISGRVEASAIGDGVATDIFTTRRVCY